MNDTGLGLLALGQTQIGGNRRTGGLVAALKPTQRIENKPYLALFRLPGFENPNSEWFLAGIVPFPKFAYILVGTLSVERRYPRLTEG